MAKLARTVGLCVAGLVALCLFLIIAFDPPPLRFHQPDSAALWITQTEVERAPGGRPSIENGLSCRERLQAHLGHGFTRPIVTFQDWLNSRYQSASDNLRVIESKRSAKGGAAWALRLDNAKKQICWLRSRDVEAGLTEEHCVPTLFNGEAAVQAGAFGQGISLSSVVFDKQSYTATVTSQGTMGAIIVYLDCFYPR